MTYGQYFLLGILLPSAIYLIYISIVMRKNKNQNIKIVKTKIISESSHQKMGSSVARGILGGAVLGPVGLLAGVASGKSRNKTTFLIEYDNGARSVVSVKNNSQIYYALCRYLDM